jgi:hypothetical protein
MPDSKIFQRVCATIFFIGIANFAVFFVMALLLGGDAVSGKIESGRYYLSSHGRLTEVSRRTYFYSRYHTYSVWIMHPLAILSAIAAQSAKKKGEQNGLFDDTPAL